MIEGILKFLQLEVEVFVEAAVKLGTFLISFRSKPAMHLLEGQILMFNYTLFFYS